MERMGVPAALQYFKNQLSCSEKYILNSDRFFYQTIKNTIEKEISSGNLKGTAFLITEDILSATRGTIYDWCLHEGSYSLSEKMLRMTEIVLLTWNINNIQTLFCKLCIKIFRTAIWKFHFPVFLDQKLL